VDVDKRASNVAPAGKVCVHREAEKGMISAQMKRARIVVRQQHLTVIENTPRDSSGVSAFQQTQYKDDGSRR
jgi:hypothetical protein